MTTPTPGAPTQPTHAERARTIVACTTVGALATVALDPAGYPFGSLAAYAIDADGNPILSLSDLAEHAHNLADDTRGSLMAAEAIGGDGGDPMALGRVTLIGDITRLDGDEAASAREIFLAAHPAAFYVDFDDFNLYRLQVASVRYVGGFGRMSWVDTGAYRAAEADPIRPHAAGVIQHMNDDHADSLVLYCEVYGGLSEVTAARMVAVDRYGFDVAATSGAGDTTVRVGFSEPMDIERLRGEMARLSRDARAAL